MRISDWSSDVCSSDLSPTHPLSADAWQGWVAGYEQDWVDQYGQHFLGFAPLFGHQYSHVWIDFRGIADAPMRAAGFDYFENSRRAALAQRGYGAANPMGRSEEHTSELQSLMRISYDVFCLKTKKYCS